MKRIFVRSLSLLLILCMALSILVACNGGEDAGDSTTDSGTQNPSPTEHIDYAGSVKLDMSSASKKLEVTVKAYIDGDTTHFNVPTSVSETGVLKARYLAVNTPESTGKIEEWGKKASKFTKSKLIDAESIYVESDDGQWNLDSTGGRHLVWVWYKPQGAAEYRNLNIEILQEGLAIASNSGQNRYGQTCLDAIAQAKAEKLNVHSGVKDPDFCYAEAISMDLRELRCNVAEYDGQKVAFEGVVTKNEDNAIYVESYDDETAMYYGMYVYYGFNLSGDGLQIISVGNHVRIVGTVSYYETGDSYQVSGLQYRVMKPDDPNNVQKLDDEHHDPAYPLTTPDTFKNGRVTFEVNEENVEYRYADLAVYSSIAMNGLTVKGVYTTETVGSSDIGAMTLYCEADGIEISVRTVVLRDENGELITEEAFIGKTIDVKGVIDYYKTDRTASFPYQIKLFSMDDVVIH
ncbi:MAG: thermonuclease family protein [Clostridia bacterium]|nr:thermonuclease family protein [Clostridia bacterium]